MSHIPKKTMKKQVKKSKRDEAMSFEDFVSLGDTSKDRRVEKIQGITVEYLTDWTHKLGKYLTMGNERVLTEDYLRGYGKDVVNLIISKGLPYKRVQIGSYGDFSYMNISITTGKVVPLDTMFLVRFLKR